MVVRVALFTALFAFGSFPCTASAQQHPEVTDARAVFSRRGQPGAVSRVRQYTRAGPCRVAVVRNEQGLYLLVGARHRRGWRSQVRQLVDASVTATSTHDVSIAIVSEVSRIFAIQFALHRRAADASRCACTAPGGTHRTSWFHLDPADALHRLIDFDPQLGSTLWNEQTKVATSTQRRGPVRCPPGCPPAPPYQLITETKYRLTGARLVRRSEERSRRYKSPGPAPAAYGAAL